MAKHDSKKHIRFFQNVYGSIMDEYKTHDDDRRLAYNSYVQIIEAYEQIDNIESAFVWVAVNDHVNASKNLIDRIIQSFENK